MTSMKLMSERLAEARYAIACMVPGAGFIGAAAQGPMAIAPAMMLLFVLWTMRIGASSASWLTLDSQEVVAHFTLRPPMRIPLARIAAVEVHRRTWGSRSFEPVTFITIFRKDEPAMIEIAAVSAEAALFLASLVANARRLGLKDVAPFRVPRSFLAHELLSLVPACLLFALFPMTFSWPACLVALGAYVLYSALVWRRYTAIAKRIAAREPDESITEWSLWLRAS